MRKFFPFLLVIFIMFLSSCQLSNDYYESGYFDGYDDGFADALSSIDPLDIVDDIDSQYLFFRTAPELEDNAIYHAREYSDWSPEEAMCVIEAYESGEKYYGSYPITEDDYRNAIRSLYYFYDYFYSRCYE